MQSLRRALLELGCAFAHPDLDLTDLPEKRRGLLVEHHQLLEKYETSWTDPKLLQCAHTNDWKQVQAEVAKEGWPERMAHAEAEDRYHRPDKLIPLCTWPCHAFQETYRARQDPQTPVISAKMTRAAQALMWSSPRARDALIEFIDGSLSHRNVTRGTSKTNLFNVLMALGLLRDHHPDLDPFDARPWLLKYRRHFVHAVDVRGAAIRIR